MLWPLRIRSWTPLWHLQRSQQLLRSRHRLSPRKLRLKRRRAMRLPLLPKLLPIRHSPRQTLPTKRKPPRKLFPQERGTDKPPRALFHVLSSPFNFSHMPAWTSPAHTRHPSGADGCPAGPFPEGLKPSDHFQSMRVALQIPPLSPKPAPLQKRAMVLSMFTSRYVSESLMGACDESATEQSA